MSIIRVGVTGGALPDNSVTDVKVSATAAINADKIVDGTTNHVFTASDDTKLTGVASGATVNSSDATLLARANHTGTQAWSTITSADEAVDDRVSALIGAGSHSGISFAYNDAAGALSATVGGIGNSAPVVNVQTAGALGDGVTDDTAAIQAAISNSTAGSTIYFPAGTYLISSQIQYRGLRSYVGSGSAYGAGAVIKQKNSANIVATTGAISGLFVPQGWYGNNTTSDDPVLIQNLKFDGNRANNGSSTASGIILMNFWSRIADCLLTNMPQHGIYLTDVTQNGSTITNSASENKIVDNRVENVGGNGIYQVSSGTAHLDGFCERNLVATVGSDAINIQRGAGWSIRRNHTYGATPNRGIRVNNAFATLVAQNYVEDFGTAAAASGNYSGIALTQQSLWGSTIAENMVGCAQTGASSTYNYLDINAGSGQATATVVVANNTLSAPTSPVGTGIGVLMYTDGGGALLTAATSGNIVRGIGTPYSAASTSVKHVTTDLTGVQTPTFAASFTPDPYSGSTVLVTGQNANTTVNNTSNQQRGACLTLIFVKDATANSYTFTWGSQYKTTITSTGTTASVRTVVHLIFDGTNWQQTGTYSGA